MHKNDSIEDVQYWSNKIKEASDELRELRTKYRLNVFTLSYEDTYKMVRLTEEIASFSSLLEDCLTNMSIKEKPSLIKRIFNKK